MSAIELEYKDKMNNLQQGLRETTHQLLTHQSTTAASCSATIPISRGTYMTPLRPGEVFGHLGVPIQRRTAPQPTIPPLPKSTVAPTVAAVKNERPAARPQIHAEDSTEGMEGSLLESLSGNQLGEWGINFLL